VRVKPISKSSKLASVCYDIRGPVLDKARQMQEEGHKIIQLNIGNLAHFGLAPPDEIVQDMIRNLPEAAGYTDSKGLFAPRKAVVHYTQEKGIRGVTVDDVYLGNGASSTTATRSWCPPPTTRCGRQPCRCRAAARCTTCATRAAAGCPTSTTSAARWARARAASSSSTPTTRPARCIRPIC
jgi:hypothetical protein